MKRCDNRQPTSLSTSNQKAPRHSNAKMLTNFSIDSIMAPDGVAELERRGERQPKLEATERVGTSLSTSPDMSTLNGPAPVKTLASPLGGQRRSKKHRPKNFQCPVCQTAFSNNGQLKNHVRIHTGERPFQCNYPSCNKTFTRNEELTRHKLIHTGVRPHSCNNCGKKFGRKDHLKKHVRTHEKKKCRKRIVLHTPSTDPISQPTLGDDSIAKRLPVVGDAQTVADLQQAYRTFAPQSNPDKSHQSQLADFIYQQTQFKHQPTTGSPHRVSISPVGAVCAHLGSAAGLSLHPQLNIANAQTLNLPTTQMQQMSESYWAKWYNFIGFYQQQQSSVVERLGRSLWK